MGSSVSKKEVTINHFFLGNVVCSRQYNKQLYTCFVKMVNRQQYFEWEKMVLAAQQAQTEGILVPEKYQVKQIKKSFACCDCPANFQMAITVQRFDFILKSQIINRSYKQNTYRQEELFLILYEMLQTAKNMRCRNTSVGDIRPGNIVVTTKQKIKFISLVSFPWQQTNIDKLLEGNDLKTVFYYAPQQIKFIQASGYSGEKFPNQKTQAFSIGLTVLQIALLKNSQQLYEMPKRNLNKKELQIRIKQLGRDYSKLHTHLYRILNLDPESRLNTGQAWARLKPYRVDIAKLTPLCLNLKDQQSSLNQFHKIGFRRSN